MLDLTSDEVRGITYDWDTGNYENYPNIYKKYRLIGTDGYGYEYTLDITNINVVNEDNNRNNDPAGSIRIMKEEAQ